MIYGGRIEPVCFSSVLKFGDLSVYRVSVLWKLSSLGLSDLVGDRRCRAGVLQVRRFNLMPQMTVGMKSLHLSLYIHV